MRIMDKHTPLETLLLVDVKAQLLLLKDVSDLAGHIQTHQSFYSQFDVKQWETIPQQALEKWAEHTAVLQQSEEGYDPNFVLEQLTDIHVQQNALIEQYNALTTPPESLSRKAWEGLVQTVFDMSHVQRQLMWEWVQAPWFKRVLHTPEEVTELHHTAQEEGSTLSSLALIGHLHQTWKSLRRLDGDTVRLQTQFSNICYAYRTARAHEHFNAMVEQQRQYNLNILAQLTNLLSHPSRTSLAYVRAVNGWAQLYLDGQDEAWSGWDVFLRNTPMQNEDSIPPALRPCVDLIKKLPVA